MVTTMVFVAFSGIDPVFFYCLRLFRGREMVVDAYTISICCQVNCPPDYFAMSNSFENLESLFALCFGENSCDKASAVVLMHLSVPGILPAQGQCYHNY